MSKVLIIGCGGVASVAIHKCCQVPEVFTEICIASRTKAKCDKLAAELAPTTTTKITTAQVDADKVEEVIGVLGLVVGGVHVVDAAGKAGVHDGQILIGQGNVHDKVRLVGVDEVAELLHIIGIDLRGGDFGLGVRGQLGSEGIALGLGAAGDAQLGENIADLAALGDGDRCNAAAADNKNFAHDGTPLCLNL